jgi:hypothetical protein
MEGFFPDGFLEGPVSFDASPSGRVAVVDEGGRRLCLGRRGEAPAVVEGAFSSLRVRFYGEQIVLLGADGLLRTLRPDGTPMGEARVRTGAANLAVTRAGGLLVTYGRRGTSDHGVTLDRFGPSPLSYKDPTLLDAVAVAVESGGFWIAGTGSTAPASRAIRLRPTASGLSLRETIALPAPPRAAAIGPDGALFVLLEPGEAVVRYFAERPEAPRSLPETAHEIARIGKGLWVCGQRGLRDVSAFLPRP